MQKTAERDVRSSLLEHDVERPERHRAWRRFLSHRAAMVGLVVMFLITTLSVLAPVVSPHDPARINLRHGSQGPSAEHWLGTDRVGRDILSRTLYGGRVSLSVGLLATAVSTTIGTVLGAVAGYAGGKVDNVIMRFTDMVMTFPPIIIILVLVSVTGPGLWNVIFVLGVLGWPGVARLVRGQLLALKEMEFVEAAIALGASPGRIVFRHLIRNALAPILVNTSFATAMAILMESGLSFLGLGVPPPTATWGNLLHAARTVSILESQPWMWLPAGIMISLTVLCINLIGDGLRDAFDPRGQSHVGR